MQKSESVSSLAKALIKAKAQFSPILKTQENPGFKRDGKASKYADLATAIEATEPALLEHGLIVSQFPFNEGERVGALTILLHESGEFIHGSFTLPILKQDAQTGVAGVTYARRCAYLGILGVAAEDDDGNTAAAPKLTPPVPSSPTASTKAVTGPPKAEIPSGTAQPSEPVAGEKPEKSLRAGSEEPLTEEGRKKYYEQVTALVNEVSDKQKMGPVFLTSDTGAPVQRKMLVYIKSVTGADKIENVSRLQWDTFFQIIEAIKKEEGGLVKLVGRINEANGGKS